MHRAVKVMVCVYIYHCAYFKGHYLKVCALNSQTYRRPGTVMAASLDTRIKKSTSTLNKTLVSLLSDNSLQKDT